jgi:GrpB-like predicted nucleotidyltransferase (UPF0157 family)
VHGGIQPHGEKHADAFRCGMLRAAAQRFRSEGRVQSLDPRYGLGLERGVNRLVAHNPLWSQAFAEEASRIKSVLGDLALAIEHCGSTSVPDIRAKPIIDLQIGVADIRHGLDFIAPLERIGYDYAGDVGIPEHHVFGKGVARTHLAHVVVFGSDQWFRTLRFRDRLRADSALRGAYEDLKLRLAAESLTRAQYTAGKAEFIERASAPA